MQNPPGITIELREGHTLRLNRDAITLVMVALDTLAGHKAAPIETRQEVLALADMIRREASRRA